MEKSAPSAPSRILIVAVNWLGDALLMTPALRALRRAYPHAHIECLVPPRVLAVFAHNPYLNGTITYDDRAPIFSPSFWKTVWVVRRRRFDLAVLFHGSRTKARLMRWAGIGERWGIAGKRGRGALTRCYVPERPGMHRGDLYLGLVRMAGIAEAGRTLDFVPDARADRSLDTLLREKKIGEGEPFAAVHPGGNWELKRWPVGHFRQWIGDFLETHPRVRVILCGAPSECGLAEKIAEGFDPSRVIVLTGKTTLDELAALFKRALFVLSNDSGPIHLAASQDARIVGLFGPTSPAQTGPWTAGPSEILWKDPGCEIPCYFRSCENRICMERLSPETVADACERMMERA